MSLADSITRRWYAKTGSRPWLARPLTWLYRTVVAVRAWMYRHHWLSSERLPVPVVVVGNITVGGTGKTPLVIAATRILRMFEWRPGVVSRGYAGSQHTPQLLPDKPDPGRFGDEPCLIARRAGVPVAVGRDRVAAAKLLLGAGCNVVIADDGLQHYRLQRDVEICVIDGERRLGNGLMLPCGPLREPPSRLDSVDFRVCNGGKAEDGEVAMQLQGKLACNARHPRHNKKLSAFADTAVHAVAGIGHPKRFFDSLRVHGLEVTEHPFPDHHAFTRTDLDFGDDLPILMTEKDFMKCAPFAGENCWYVPVNAGFTADFPVSFVTACGGPGPGCQEADDAQGPYYDCASEDGGPDDEDRDDET